MTKKTAGNVSLSQAQDALDQVQSDFVTVKDLSTALYLGFDEATRQTHKNNLSTNWNSLGGSVAGLNTRTNALRAVLSMVVIAVWLVYLLVKHIEARVKRLEGDTEVPQP